MLRKVYLKKRCPDCGDKLEKIKGDYNPFWRCTYCGHEGEIDLL